MKRMMNLEAHSYRCKTPVAFLIFCRPETTERVFAEIAKAKPPKLLVVADGPRQHRPGEAERCVAARKIIERIDWDCELSTNYADDNMGCKRRVSTGVEWVLNRVDEAIFLEDDCLPHRSFFKFCDEMLEKYRNDERIMAINGTNFQFGRKRWDHSYYYSRYNHVWGWASWQRAWAHYDVNLSRWPMLKEGGWLNDILGSTREMDYWSQVFDQVHRGEIDTWDYQWIFACWLQSGLSVVPNMNLVSNIGFTADATHTAQKSRVAEMVTEEMLFPLKHPPVMIRDSRADRDTARLFFRRSLLSRAKMLIAR